MTTHNCWDVAEAVIGISRRVLLKGKPGTGKTFAATHLALPEDTPVFSLTLTEETPMAEIRGHFVTKGGEFVWMDGPAVRAWKEGGRLVLNEIDHASDDVLTFMYAIMDDPEYAEVTLPTGETVRPAAGFHLIATMNGELYDLPDALQDRLPVSIDITQMNPEALLSLPEDLRGPAENTAMLDNDQRNISVRAWQEFALLREKLDDRMAADAVFAEKAKDALLALQVGETASEPHNMEGIVVGERARNRLLAIERVHDWVETRRAQTGQPPGAQTVNDELRYILGASSINALWQDSTDEYIYEVILLEGALAERLTGDQAKKLLHG
jgi:MoxR-like ATPase